MGPLKSGIGSINLSVGERKQVMRAWDLAQRCSGFQLFAKSKDVQDRLPGLLKLRDRSLRYEAEQEGVEFVEELDLTALHAIKTELWRELPTEVREDWQMKAKESQMESHLSWDPYVALLSNSLPYL